MEDGAVLTISDESSQDGGLSAPADGLLLLGLVSPESASLVASVESSDNSGTLPESGPGALGELVLSSGPGDAVLALSDEFSDNLGSLEHESALGTESPWSDASDPLLSIVFKNLAVLALSDERLDDGELVGPADGLLGLASLPDSASLAALFLESSDDSSTSHWSNPTADGPLVKTSLVGDAVLALSVELSDNLSGQSGVGASDPLSSGLGPESASSSVSDESSEDSALLAPANGSLVVARFPDGALVGVLGELSHDSGVWEVLAPGASGPLVQTSSVGDASLALSSPSSDDLSSGGSPASHLLVAWSGDQLALSAVSNESSQDGALEVPAHGSGLVGLWLLEDGASVGALSESSDDLGTLPVSLPGASGPLSETSGEGCASLALSHPDSDDSALVDNSLDALGEVAVASSVLSADLVLFSPSLDDSGALEVEFLSDDASGEPTVASLVDGASSVASVESSEDLVGGVASDTSGPGSVALSVDSALGTSLVLVGLDNRSANGGAHLSLSLGRLPDSAELVAVSELADELGSLHDSSPDAFGGVLSSNLGDGALLEASLEGSEDLGVGHLLDTFVDDASGPLSVAESAGHAVGVAPLELSNDLGTLRNGLGSLGLALGSGHVALLVGLAGHLVLVEGLDEVPTSVSI